MVTSYLFERLAYTKKLMYFCHTVEQVKIIRKIVLDYFIYFPPGYPKDDIGKTIDTSPVWDIRKRAIQQHVSQKDDIEFIMKIHEKLPREEHFLVWEKATV
ncbi:hypothetical protein A3D08_03085 [Candidatus Roizmanbacteria bacterium RIFCSPHIGHO2_02_FULL_43_11]|nr:MAG: hypothetical protein A3D08_03085 [Candidatus Roizmanbacteria bacterium RIFCSPHIGHO2_02_FULL_43_11]